jgi:hypothetical protein
LAGIIGPAAVAGYGTGARLEYLLVPLVFGLGAPVAAMVGTSIGAGKRERALRAAWTGAALAGGITEAIGLAAAFYPSAFLTLFGNDPKMIETGTLYLHIVGPTYGFFGGGLALYFASQGAGRVGWPMMVAVLRVVIAAGGGWLAVKYFGGSTALFVVIAAALVIYGLANVVAVASGVWFKKPKSKRSGAVHSPVIPAFAGTTEKGYATFLPHSRVEAISAPSRIERSLSPNPFQRILFFDRERARRQDPRSLSFVNFGQNRDSLVECVHYQFHEANEHHAGNHVPLKTPGERRGFVERHRPRFFVYFSISK